MDRTKPKKNKLPKGGGGQGSSKLRPYITHGIVFIIALLVAYATPLANDLYDVTLGKLFEKKATIDLYSISTTSLEPIYSDKGKKYYYEITTLKIINSGNKSTSKTARLNIQANGKILGITPKDLSNRLIINTNDLSTGSLDISQLGPDQIIDGELHSLSNIRGDRNESLLGFDRPKGDKYIFNGPNSL